MGETFPPSMDIVVFFASGSSRLDRYAVTHLRRLVRRLESDSSLQRIEIHGHADGSATSHVNNAISRRRAEHARDYLIRRGIAPGRLVIVVHGEDRPVEKNTSREGRSANRRVEFVIPGGN
jgi:outer membrane protein OmpA-like peptidoglycan-associated protein